MTNAINRLTVEDAQRKLRQAKLQLLKAKVILDDDEYYERLSTEDQSKALLQSLQIGPEILKIENAQIALLMPKIKGNMLKLEGATKELQKALDEIEDITRILKAITGLLGVVASILAPMP